MGSGWPFESRKSKRAHDEGKDEVIPEYAAGYFDGEGTIGLYWNKGSKDPRYRSGKRGGCWVRTVSINNTYISVLGDFYSLFGGSLRIMREARGTHRQMYTWSVGSVEDIEHVLTYLLPHLREKRPQADVMLSFVRDQVDGEEASRRLKELKRV